MYAKSFPVLLQYSKLAILMALQRKQLNETENALNPSLLQYNREWMVQCMLKLGGFISAERNLHDARTLASSDK